MSAIAEFDALFTAMAEAFARHPSDMAGELATCLRRADTERLQRAPQSLAICSHLPAMLAQPDHVVTSLIAGLAERLHWRVPGFGRLPPDVAEGLAVVELLGPDGMFKESRLRCGLLLQAAGHHYPSHRHAAEELYLTLAGEARWLVGEAEPVRLTTGQFSHHPSWQPHAMTTCTTPLLAMWGWRGDIGSTSYQA